jgi:hypothetical protein
MKIIRVESCRKCPYKHEFVHGGPDFCKITRLRLEYKLLDTIPDWCPLEDEK